MAKSKKPPTGAAVKRINKKMNKLAKKGKLKKGTKERLRGIQFERSSGMRGKQEAIEADWKLHQTPDEEEEEDILPLDMLDPESDQGFLPASFLEENISEPKEKRRKKGEKTTEQSGLGFENDGPRSFQ